MFNFEIFFMLIVTSLAVIILQIFPPSFILVFILLIVNFAISNFIVTFTNQNIYCMGISVIVRMVFPYTQIHKGMELFL